MRWNQLMCAAFIAIALGGAASCGGGGGGGGGGGSSPPPPPPPPPPPASGIVVTLAPSQTFQTMQGWEVSPRMWIEDKVNNRYNPEWLTYRDQLLDRLVNELGVNRIRVELVSGAENPIDYYAQFYAGQLSYTSLRQHRYERINDNSDPQTANAAGFKFTDLNYQIDNLVLPMRQRLQARGETLYINLCYIDFDFQNEPVTSTVNHATNSAEYAELIQAAVQHMRNRGVTPDGLEIILEPDLTRSWRGAQVGQGMVAAAARLGQIGVRPHFIAPSTSNAGSAASYIDAMMAVPGATGLPNMFSYHSYDNPSNAVRSTILQRAQQFSVATGMLEHIGANADELTADLTFANVSAWQQYGIATTVPVGQDDDGYLMLVDPTQPANQRIRLASRTAALAQQFRHVRQGARRIGATAAQTSIRPVAFINTNGFYVVNVYSQSANDISISGLPAGIYGVQYSTGAESAINLADVSVASGQSATARIPASGVISFYRK